MAGSAPKIQLRKDLDLGGVGWGGRAESQDLGGVGGGKGRGGGEVAE